MREFLDSFCKMAMLSRFVALPALLTWKVSLLQSVGDDWQALLAAGR